MESEWALFIASVLDSLSESLTSIAVVTKEPFRKQRSPEAAEKVSRGGASSVVSEGKSQMWEHFGEAMDKDFLSN